VNICIHQHVSPDGQYRNCPPNYVELVVIDEAERLSSTAIEHLRDQADPDEHAELKSDYTRLATQLANTCERLRDVEEQSTETQEELVAAKQLNIDYFQQLNLARSVNEREPRWISFSQ